MRPDAVSAAIAAATSSGVASALPPQPASSQKSSGRWTTSRTGLPKPLPPSTRTHLLLPFGTAGSQSAWALSGRRLLPSASTST